MRGAIAAIAVLLLGVTPAWASGYSDFNNGVALNVRDNPQEAIKSLTAALASPDLPSHLVPVAHLVRGNIYGDEKRFDAAIADYTTAIVLKKDYVDALVARCLTYYLQSKLPQAIADCSQAIALRPDNWKFYELRIAIYVDARRFDDALADYNTFIAKRPNELALRLQHTEILRKAGRFDAAIAGAKATRDFAPKWAAPIWEQSLVYASANDLPNALASAKAAVKLEKDPVGLELEGQIEWALGQYGDAEDAFEDALDADAGRKYAFVWLRIAQARNGSRPSSRIAARIAQTDLTDWAGKLVSLYLDKTTPAEFLADDEARDQPCSTNFFVGQWYMIHGGAADAKKLLLQAQTACASDTLFSRYVAIDLARSP